MKMGQKKHFDQLLGAAHPKAGQNTQHTAATSTPYNT